MLSIWLDLDRIVDDLDLDLIGDLVVVVSGLLS